MGLTIALATGRDACSESVHGFLRAVDSFSEYDLLAASRCHGWARLEVVAHVVAGWQEMLQGLVSAVDGDPTVDAASYWRAFADDFGDDDPVEALTAQRRRAVAYVRPGSAVAQLHDVGASVLRGVAGLSDRARLWQGHVFSPGDFLAVWAVENVVHQLDLLSDEPAPAGALSLVRSTIEELVGTSLPETWDDEEAALIGTGRLPLPQQAQALSSHLPALG